MEGKKFALQAMSLYFVVLFCVTAVVSLQRLANFSPCDPLIFCFSPTLWAQSLLKNDFFFECSWVIFEKGTEREIFRLMRFPNIEAKRYFLHCSAL